MHSAIPDIPIRRKLLIVVATLAVALSWTGSLDDYSGEYLDDALISGGLVYATARGINAAVSVLQGTEITPAVATFTVGEVLDPVNDLIERFSGMLLWALGSLALQKILLQIFSHQGFSVLLTALALLVVATSFATRYASWFNTALKCFIVTVATRFALSLVVLASAAVDHVFLQSADAERHAEMTKLQGELQVLSTSKPGAATADEVAGAEVELGALRERQSEQQQAVERLRDQLSSLNSELDSIRSDVPLTCRLNPICDEGERVNAKKLDILAAETELDAAETAREATEASIGEKREFLKCAQRERAGEPCSFWGQAYSLISPTAWSERFASVGDRMDDYASNIISLLVSFLAKTVLIPLLFLYSVIQLFKLALNRLLVTERTVTQK